MTISSRLSKLAIVAIGVSSPLAFSAITSPAFAGSATTDLIVSSSVENNCSISTTPLAFGVYDTLGGSPVTGAGTVTVTCTAGASATITLGQGANADGASTDADPLRRMKSGTNYLSYDLYQDAGRSTVWGNTVGTAASHTGTGAAANFTVYGEVPAGQNVPAGSYADTVVATVNF